MANEYSGMGGRASMSADSADMGFADEPEEAGDGERAVHYYFPVEIEVRNAADDVDRDAIVAETLRRLTEGIRGA